MSPCLDASPIVVVGKRSHASDWQWANQCEAYLEQPQQLQLEHSPHNQQAIATQISTAAFKNVLHTFKFVLQAHSQCSSF